MLKASVQEARLNGDGAVGYCFFFRGREEARETDFGVSCGCGCC
jgi:hypothetical protein